MSLPNQTYKDVTAKHNRSNFYAQLVPGQTIIEIPEYHLECGETLVDFPVAYKTWGRLNADGDNVLLIQHALTGLCDVQDWWGALLGTGKTFDPSRFFIVCVNLLGSPYGSCSPVTIESSTGKPYGPLFPLCTVKDDLGVQRLVLDSLGVKLIACVIGGLMGGMVAMEYSSTYNNSPYVRSIIALATSARALAWCISWNEAQRQCIFSDPYYDDGYYYEGSLRPNAGLSAARMSALLTYRSRNSFEARFGRKLPSTPQSNVSDDSSAGGDRRYPSTKEEENWLSHNAGSSRQSRAQTPVTDVPKPQTFFTAQTYLRYQGNKFVKRFDANCYIAITRKLDTHDITRGHLEPEASDAAEDPLPEYLKTMTKPHLIVGILSDGLFTYGEQQLLGEYLPDATLKKLESHEGHDAFLLEFELIDSYCTNFLKSRCPDLFDEKSGKINVFDDWADFVKTLDNGGTSVFGEVEKNLTDW